MILPPCLVVTSIGVSGKEVSANIEIGPRHERLVIDLSTPGFTHIKEMPQALNTTIEAQRALFDVMRRAYRGEPVDLPADLSSAIRNVSEAWPLRPKPDESEQPADIQITKAEHDAPEPGMTTVSLRVLGIPTLVVVDEQDGKDRAMRFRFVSGVHPWQLTDAEAWAMLLALSEATGP